MKKTIILTILTIVSSFSSWSQCNTLATATPSVNLVGPSMNGSGIAVAYIPSYDYYYSVSGGNSTSNIVTFDNTGAEISVGVNTGIDHRGLWWNPNASQLETNSFNDVTGVSIIDLDASNYALNTNSTLFNNSQPDAQSLGEYDYDNDEIIYYLSGQIYRVNHSTGASISNYAITGLPVASTNLNENFIAYTGCVGKEIIVFDMILGKVYYIDKLTGAYVGETIITGVTPTNWYDVSYANYQIFYRSGTTWTGNYIFQPCSETQSTLTVDACDTYIVPSGDETYTTSGVYNDTIPNVLGCDSVMTITVNITTIDLTTTINNFTISANDNNASYQWITCVDNQPISGAINQTYLAEANGDYAVIITNGPCSDTSACVTIAGVGIDEVGLLSVVEIYPNPNNGEFTLNTTLPNATFSIYGIDGKLVLGNVKVTQPNQTINLENVENGVYFVTVKNKTNQKTIRLIIQ